MGQNSQRIESNSVTRPSELVEEVTLREPEYSLDFQLFGGDLDEGTFLEDEDSGIRQTPSIDESISNRGFRIRDKSNDPATSGDENSPTNSPQQDPIQDLIDAEGEANLINHLAAITLETTLSLDENEKEIDLAKELASHLIHFTGCGSEAHLIKSQKHIASEPVANRSHHLSLAAYHQLQVNCRIPDVISQTEPLSFQRREKLPAPDWARAFEGSSSSLPEASLVPDRPQSPNSNNSSTNPSRIVDELCLKCSQISSHPTAISFDIDSFLGYAQSLAFARQGLDINLFPRFYTNIQSNLHIYTTVYYDSGKGEKPFQVQLHKVPHYRVGRVSGHGGTNVYIFFPRMYAPDKPTNFPGKGGGETSHQLRFWTDQILLPALFRHVNPTSRQHYPTSWDQARRRSKAFYNELRGQTGDEEDLAHSLTLHNSVHPEYLGAIWEDIEQQLLKPENYVFSQAQIFFSSKNTKLQYPSPTLKEGWELFNSMFTTIYNPQYLD